VFNVDSIRSNCFVFLDCVGGDGVGDECLRGVDALGARARKLVYLDDETSSSSLLTSAIVSMLLAVMVSAPTSRRQTTTVVRCRTARGPSSALSAEGDSAGRRRNSSSAVPVYTLYRSDDD